MTEPAKQPERALCTLCGEPMPPGEEMFYYHGYSGPCPKPQLPKQPEPAVGRATSGLTFDELREANVSRCEGPTFGHTIASWTPTDWACAMAGECGEACNLIKKLRRGEAVPLDEIGRELADLVTYADLLAARLGIDLGEAVAMKFNEVSIRRGATERLLTKIARAVRDTR
jgi:NTP pyrophosphatase (non-canonical NTP hydrolase)